MTVEQENEQAKSIRKIVIGSIIAQYGGYEMLDGSKHQLKQKVRRFIESVRDIQNYFITHPNATRERREEFRREFHKDEIYLLSELVELIWGIPADDLENIIKTLKQHIQTTTDNGASANN